jgi:hypothetical protein
MDKNPISAHRAFVYGASVPGLGEFYAGARTRGTITALLFLCFSVWLTWTMVGMAETLADQFFNALDGTALPDLPYLSMGISLLGIYFIWLWAMISAVDVAVEHRHKTVEPLQTSVLWAVMVSWFCPGAGQVYTADRRLGYILFTAYLMGMLFIVPAYRQMFQSISDLVTNQQLSPTDPLGIIDVIHNLTAEVNLGFGKLVQKSVLCFAMADTMAALRRGPLKSDPRWSTPSMGYGAALAGIGWLCPGSGQLLQRHDKTGWYFLAGFIGSNILTGLLFNHDFISIQRADTLTWIPIFIQWGAIIESLFRMMKGKRQNPKNSDHVK